MAKIALFLWFPISTAPKVNEISTRQQKYVNPNRVLKIVFGPISWIDGDGARGLWIYEVANDKVYDGMTQLMWYLNEFRDIEGYRYEIKTVYGGEELQEAQKVFDQMNASVKK